MARYANVSDLKRLGRIRNLPEAKAYEPYPETAQPQNDLEIASGESRERFDPDMQRMGFYYREAQNGYNN